MTSSSTGEEAARYPGSFEGGVLLSQAEVWSHPVAMKSVLSELALSEKNPGRPFLFGLVRVTKEDYVTVVSVGSGHTPSAKTSDADVTPNASVQAPPSAGGTINVALADAAGPIDVTLLFKTVEKLKPAAKLGGSLSEYDTRAEFIDKYLEALGYTELGDVQRGSPVDSGNFPDYVLRVNGKAAIAIEAKKLGAPLGERRPPRSSPTARISECAGAR